MSPQLSYVSRWLKNCVFIQGAERGPVGIGGAGEAMHPGTGAVGRWVSPSRWTWPAVTGATLPRQSPASISSRQSFDCTQDTCHGDGVLPLKRPSVEVGPHRSRGWVVSGSAKLSGLPWREEAEQGHHSWAPWKSRGTPGPSLQFKVERGISLGVKSPWSRLHWPLRAVWPQVCPCLAGCRIS